MGMELPRPGGKGRTELQGLQFRHPKVKLHAFCAWMDGTKYMENFYDYSHETGEGVLTYNPLNHGVSVLLVNPKPCNQRPFGHEARQEKPRVRSDTLRCQGCFSDTN